MLCKPGNVNIFITAIVVFGIPGILWFLTPIGGWASIRIRINRSAACFLGLYQRRQTAKPQ